MILPPPSSTLFPYTTLSRSLEVINTTPASRQETASNTSFRNERPNPPGLKRRRCTRAATTSPLRRQPVQDGVTIRPRDRKSTRLNSSHLVISYAVFCLNKKH